MRRRRILLCVVIVLADLGVLGTALAGDAREPGLYLSWPAVTVILTVLGIAGTLLGFIRNNDLGRINDRCQLREKARAEAAAVQEQLRRETIDWMQRLEDMLREALKQRGTP